MSSTPAAEAKAFAEHSQQKSNNAHINNQIILRIEDNFITKSKRKTTKERINDQSHIMIMPLKPSIEASKKAINQHIILYNPMIHMTSMLTFDIDRVIKIMNGINCIASKGVRV